MFKAKVVPKFYNNFQICRRGYLPNQLKTVWTDHVIVPQLDNQKLQLISNRNEIDSYLISVNKEKKDNVYDLCLKQRSLQTTQNSGELTNYVLINHLVASNETELLLRILFDRPTFGVFLNDCSACLVLNHLLEIQDYSAAVDVVIKILTDKINNELISALCTYASFKYIEQIINQQNVKGDISAEEKTNLQAAGTQKQNAVGKSDKSELLTKTIRSLARNYSADIQTNFKALIFLLSNNHDELYKLISAESKVICKDILKLCQDSMKETDKQTVNEQLPLLDEKLKLIIEDSLKKHESYFIEKQANICAQWLQQIEENLKIDLDKFTDINKIKELKNAIAEMQSNQQKFWFFKESEQIALTIFHKKIVYPKRWFGKKKQSKVADQNYVPPEVRQKNL